MHKSCFICLELHHICKTNNISPGHLGRVYRFTYVADICTCLPGPLPENTRETHQRNMVRLPGKSQTFAFTHNQTITPLSIIVIHVQQQPSYIAPRSSSCSCAHHLVFFIVPGMHHLAAWFLFHTTKQLS